MKAKKLVCLATAAVMTASVAALLAGCGDEKLTVTWYNGRTVLQEDEVEKGATVKEWTPTRDGFVFTGWYEEASLTNKFDFNTKIEEDTQIYSGWRSATVESDARIWYAIGGGAETLKASNWQFATEAATNESGVILDENGYATFTKKEGFDSVILSKAENSNVFTIQLKLRGGDKFRFLTNAINSDWTGDKGKAEAGLGSVTGFEYAAGVNPETKANDPNAPEVTAESKEYGVVKIDNEVVFEGGKEFNADPKGWNFFLADGQDGIYEFTLTTYPGEDTNNTLTVERKEKLAPLTETHKMYLVGTYNAEKPNDWQDPATDKLYLDKQDDGTFRTFITVTEANYPTWDNVKQDSARLKVKNEIDGKDYGVASADGNIPLTAGTWCITYNPTGNVVKYEKCNYYVYGTFLDGETAVNYSIKDGVTPKMTTTDNLTYTATFTATDVTGNSSYAWIKNEGKPGVFAIKVLLHSSLGTKEYTAAGGDNFYLTAGEHTVTLTVADGKVTVS